MKPHLEPRRNLWIGFGSVLLINFILAFFPGFLWAVWLAQVVYLIPACIILGIMKKSKVIGGMLLAAGATMILDALVCGFGIRL